eukprot:6981954-Prymnesium_polylepis.1
MSHPCVRPPHAPNLAGLDGAWLNSYQRKDGTLGHRLLVSAQVTILGRMCAILGRVCAILGRVCPY